MYMFEQLVKKVEHELVGAIGAKVVDDTQSITIPVAEEDEGNAVITNVDKPSEFTPNVIFGIDVSVKNTGEDDTIFVMLSCIDTGNPLAELSATVGSGSTKLFTFNLMLTQNTTFHGLIEAGHVE